MWKEGKYQFLPFAITVIAIVFTNLLTGILIGLGVSLLFILYSNFRRPIHQVLEKHISGNVMRIELPPQVSFLNRAAIQKSLYAIPAGGSILIDARNADYIDPDILDLLYRLQKCDSEGTRGGVFKRSDLRRSTADLMSRFPLLTIRAGNCRNLIKPREVLDLLKAGHQRFLDGRPLVRDLRRQAGSDRGWAISDCSRFGVH